MVRSLTRSVASSWLLKTGDGDGNGGDWSTGLVEVNGLRVEEATMWLEPGSPISL